MIMCCGWSKEIHPYIFWITQSRNWQILIIFGIQNDKEIGHSWSCIRPSHQDQKLSYCRGTTYQAALCHWNPVNCCRSVFLKKWVTITMLISGWFVIRGLDLLWSSYQSNLKSLSRSVTKIWKALQNMKKLGRFGYLGVTRGEDHLK